MNDKWGNDTGSLEKINLFSTQVSTFISRDTGSKSKMKRAAHLQRELNHVGIHLHQWKAWAIHVHEIFVFFTSYKLCINFLPYKSKYTTHRLERTKLSS